MKFFACPPTSETLICLIFVAGFVLCGSVYLYDSIYQTTVYPASIYGDDAVAKEIFRSGVGCINCGLVALATITIFLFAPKSSAARMCSFCAKHADPRDNAPLCFEEDNPRQHGRRVPVANNRRANAANDENPLFTNW